MHCSTDSVKPIELHNYCFQRLRTKSVSYVRLRSSEARRTRKFFGVPQLFPFLRTNMKARRKLKKSKFRTPFVLQTDIKAEAGAKYPFPPALEPHFH